MTKTKTKDAEQETQAGSLGWILFIAIGLAALAGLYAFSNMLKDKDEEAPELPLVSIMIEVNQFDANARAQIVLLENGLKATGLFQGPYGPPDLKLLLPGAKAGDAPVAKLFSDLTDAEWESAWKYVVTTEYYVPRVFRLDGTACVIRLDPKGGHGFAPDAAAKLQQVCEGFKDKFKSFRIYSRALGVGSAQDRDALNASFGVQLSWIMVEEPVTTAGPAPTWKTAAGLTKLARAKGVLKSEKHFRRVTTDASWVSYYYTVKLQMEKEGGLPTTDPEVVEAFDFAQANGIGTLLSKDGRLALVDTSTDCEGQDNAHLLYVMAANLQEELKVEVRSNYQPVMHYKFRGEMTPDTPR